MSEPISGDEVVLIPLSSILQGLKFKRFPYLLTLQLKRFDFDYSTMHRIKLNDRYICVHGVWQPKVVLTFNISSLSSQDDIS